VLGGSSGAHRLNIGALFAFTSLRKTVINFTIVHQTGSVDEGLVGSGYQQAGIAARVIPFIDDMAAALAAADLVVARAGAMTVSELALAGRPSILVPYPFHRDRQQEHNARTLERVGAAIIVPDDDHLGENLSRKLLELNNDRARLVTMAQRALSMARPDAAAAIARTCLEIAEAR
ncbi:MAG TPA: glycosyltransferase, partial [Candidatus Binataceae bacterium]|nr:glycosyltransferase [Candidatus Binataceae bacterium]